MTELIKANNYTWATLNGALYATSSRLCKDVEYVAQVPEEYKDAAMMAYKNEETNQDFLMFLKATKSPIRYNLEKSIFEKMVSTGDDRWEWREY